MKMEKLLDVLIKERLFNIINLINNNISLKYYYYNIYYVK